MALLFDLAKSEGRTVSNYVEQLIIEQIKKIGELIPDFFVLLKCDYNMLNPIASSTVM